MYKIFYICLQHRHKGHAVLSSAPNRSMMASSPWEAAYFLSWSELRGAVSGMEVVESFDLELCDTCQPMAEPNYAGSDIRPTAGAGFTLTCSLQLSIRLFDKKNLDFIVVNYQYIVKTSRSPTRKILTNILGELLGSSDRLWPGTACAQKRSGDVARATCVRCRH